MSYKLLFCAVVLCGLIAKIHYDSVFRIRVNRFVDYLNNYNKSYKATEFHMRMLIFEETLKEIEKLNSKDHGTGATHGLNKMSDWTAEERYGINSIMHDNHCYRYTEICTTETLHGITKSPVNGVLDWRDNDGVIGPVLNQKMCNGCWAFSIIGVMESMAAIEGLGSQQLSIQELLDCSDVNLHCHGGDIVSALKLMCNTDLHITTEDNYPLTLLDEDCRRRPANGRLVANYTIHCYSTDDHIKELLKHGPVMIVVNPSSMYTYLEGIIRIQCPPHSLGMTHVVQIVGYGHSPDPNGDEVQYFIIRNSWGSDWGEDGYIRVAMGDRNLCGINNNIASLYVT